MIHHYMVREKEPPPALQTFSLTILALICAMASFSNNFNSPSPTAHVQVLNINRFQKKSNGDDEIGMKLSISTDLQSLFTWNTKQVFVFLAAQYGTPKNALNQVSLWDDIIQLKENAKFTTKFKNKYRFIDQVYSRNMNVYPYVNFEDLARSSNDLEIWLMRVFVLLPDL